MGMDRNTIIGFVLLGVLLFIYLFTASKNNQQLERQRLREADSVAAIKKQQEVLHVTQDSAKVKVASGDSLTGFNKAIGGTEKLLTVENDLLKIVFSNKGGQPREVVLKHFKLYDSSLVRIVDSNLSNRLNYDINTGTGQVSHITDLYFDGAKVEKSADGTQTITYRVTGTIRTFHSASIYYPSRQLPAGLESDHHGCQPVVFSKQSEHQLAFGNGEDADICLL